MQPAGSLAQRFRRPLDALVSEKTNACTAWSSECLNCTSPLSGPFCAQCGQRAIPPYPSVRELVTDAFWELSGWDGRFAGTMRALLRAPGRLTTAFLEGRRVRYISPLRLYLVASLVYFLVAASAPNLRPNGVIDAPGITITEDKATAVGRVTSATEDARSGGITPEERAKAMQDIARAPAFLRPVLRRGVTDPNGLKKSLFTSMPRVLFALVPVFAAIVGLFFRRRKYPEHLYFGLHLHALVFVALTLSALVKFTYVVPLAATVGVIAAIWIVVYAILALRYVYGESLARTIAKAVGIGVLYAIASGAAIVGLVFWAALFT